MAFQSTTIKRNLQDEQGHSEPKRWKIEGDSTPSTSCQREATDFPRLTCKLCSQQYKDPRLLDCLHSFCQTCLDKPQVFKTSVIRGRFIRCPDCYQETDVPQTGVSGLDQDCITAKYVQEQAVKAQVLAPETLCQSCNEHQPAIVRCQDCKTFLCTSCNEKHQRFTRERPHTLVTMADLKSGKGALKKKQVDKVVKCKRHANQDLAMFCKTCQERICMMCTFSTHCKPDHDVTDIKSAAASFRTEINKVLTQTKTNFKEHQAAKITVEQAKKRLESNLNEAVQMIDKKKKSEVGKLTRRANILRVKAQSVATERKEELEKCIEEANSINATETEYILNKVKSIVKDGDCHDIITLKEKALKNLKQASLKKPQNVPLDLSFIDFAESLTSGNNLGELRFEEKWVLRENFGNMSVPACDFVWAKAVATCSNGDIVVVDCGSSKVIILTSKGVHKGLLSSTDHRGILQNPIDIAISSSENMLVLDTEVRLSDTAVKVFNKEGKFTVRMFLPQGVLMSKCIDAGNGKVVLGMEGKIHLFNEDVSNPTSFSAKLIDKHIAICSKTESLIYTNYDKSKLISVTFSGKKIFDVQTIIEGKSVKPTGVCTDKKGDIYIAAHTGTERGTGEIHHYSPEGSYIGMVAKGLYNPLGLFYSPNDELIVADRNSVKVFSRS